MAITLEEAKAYLQVDFDDDDLIIQQCIDSALAWVETYTGYVLVEGIRELYANHCGVVDTCLYPFEVVTADVSIKRRATSALLTGKPNEAIEITVGNWGDEPIKPQLLSSAYKLITYMYENRDMYPVTLPTDLQMLINQLRRSATI